MVTFRNFQRIHLVGIGGSGMSGIAETLLTRAMPIPVPIKSLLLTELLCKWARPFSGHHR